MADYNLTLGNLIGMLNLFFTKLGMKDLKFKPAYNPYTEPSMEIFAYHPLLKKEVEIGNSGACKQIRHCSAYPDVRCAGQCSEWMPVPHVRV